MRWLAAIFGTILICTSFSWYMYQSVYLPRSRGMNQRMPAVTRTATPPPSTPSRIPLKTPEPVETFSDSSSSMELPNEVTETSKPLMIETTSPLNAVVEGENSQMVYVINGPVNIRVEPSTKGQILLVAPNNTTLELLNEQKQADNYDWEKIRLPYGDEGWIAKTFVSKEKSTDLPSDSLVVKSIKAKQVNIRNLPTTKAKIIAKARLGTTVKVNEKAIRHEGFLWVQVHLDDGQNGWIVSRFLDEQ